MKSLIIKLNDARGSLGGGFGFFVATGLVSLASFLLNLIVSRLLGPANYGSFGSLQNAYQVLTVPIMAIAAAITQAEASKEANGSLGVAIGRALNRFCQAGLAAVAVLAVISPVVRSYLHLNSILPVLFLAVSILPAIVTTVLQGVLMGRLKFRPVAVATLIGTGLGRLILGVALVELGMGYTGAIAATVIGQIITSVILVAPLWREFRSDGRDRTGIKLRGSLLSISGLLGTWVFISEDTILTKHFLPSHEAGLYAASATAGRIALFLPGAIGQIAFPRFVKSKGHYPALKRVFWWSLIGTLGLGSFAAVVLLVLPSLVIRILFGSAYLGGVGVLRILGLEAAALGIITLLVYFQLAQESISSQMAWIGVVAAYIGLTFFHGTPEDVALVMLVSAGLTTLPLVFVSIQGLYLTRHQDVIPKSGIT